MDAPDRQDRVARKWQRPGDSRARDERELGLDEREARADESSLGARLSTEQRERRRLEAVERSRARLAATADRLERDEALAQRIEAQENRERAESAREAATTERESNRPPLREIHRPSGPPATLRRQVTRIALKLAEMEDKITRTHADMATQWPDRAAG